MKFLLSLFKRQPNKLQVRWMEQGAMMKWCGMTEFDRDATIAKWQRKGYNNDC